MKKTLSLILALLMSVSCASFAFADEAEEAELTAAIADEAVEEAEEASIYDEAISFLNVYGIYKGYGDDKMGANDDIQRYQMALFTSRIATGWTDDAAWNTGIWDAAYTEFTDVNEAPAANYLGAISYANQNGIIEGYGDGTFGPTDGITYQNALTMVVRALGFQNLAWPWGYIEKAINLGLTAGIVDVAYTDVLTRGEVAQVIYNALFATTKDGTTLAAKNFGIEFGWETIMVVASDGAFYAPDGKKAEKGIVAYKVVNSDGTLGEDTFYTKASTFGFTGHEDELAVGKAFKVCFGTDGLLAAKSLYTETIWNLGEKVDGKYPIQAYLDAYTAVSKFTETTYITTNGKIAYDSEIIIKESTYGTTVETTTVDHEQLAIDWISGDILQKQADGTYAPVWYYNQLLGDYYKVKTKATVNGDIEIIGIDIMDEKDVEDLLKALNVKSVADVNAFKTIGVPAATAYASLELFDLNNNGEAEYGIYTAYSIGKLSTGTKDDHNAKREYVEVAPLSNKLAAETYNLINGTEIDTIKSNGQMIVCGACGDCENAQADIWWTDDYAPDKDDDGVIDAGYVIYNYNKATRELRVLKYIDDVRTGVLRAYKVEDQTINIDGKTYSFKYDDLLGNFFPTTDNLKKSGATRAITSAYLRSLFNQFVEFVVADDAVVYVARKGENTKNFIIVESFAGISSDGYIVVNGYTTKDLKLTQFKIGSYNGWQKGDYFYNLSDKDAADSFSKGALYQITSYDEANDAYYVYLAGELNDNAYEVTELTTSAFDFNGADDLADGYIYEGGERKMTSDDKWIILGTVNEDGYAPMSVYTGKVYDETWTVKGDRVDVGDGKIYFIVNATDVNGFNFDVYASSFVVFLRDAINSAKYDEYDAEGWYLLGASTYDVKVFDLLDGTEKTVSAQNVNLKKFNVYKTIDGKIVDDAPVANVFMEAFYAYRDTASDVKAGTETADYVSGIISMTKDSAYLDNGKDAFSKFITTAELGFTKEHTGYCDGVQVFLATADTDNKGNVTVTEITDVSSKDSFKKNCAADEYVALYIYNVATKKVVIYITDDFAFTTDEENITVDSKYMIEVDTDAYIDATADVDTVAVNGELESAKINSVTFFYTGEATEDTHFNVAMKGFTFGKAGECTAEAWNTTVDGEPVYGSIVEALYAPHAEDVDDCDMVKAVTVDFDGIEVKEDEWTTIEVTFSGNKSTATEYVLTVCAIIKDGQLAFSIDKSNTCSEAGTAFTEFVAK